MIQRIQTIYSLISIIVCAVGAMFFTVWEGAVEFLTNLAKETFDNIFYIISAAVVLISIFMFKNRKLQLKLNGFAIILNVILLGFFVYWLLSLPGEMQISEKGIEMLVPVLSIVFLIMANKAIKKDEALVKSADRLR